MLNNKVAGGPSNPHLRPYISSAVALLPYIDPAPLLINIITFNPITYFTFDTVDQKCNHMDLTTSLLQVAHDLGTKIIGIFHTVI